MIKLNLSRKKIQFKLSIFSDNHGIPKSLARVPYSDFQVNEPHYFYLTQSRTRSKGRNEETRVWSKYMKIAVRLVFLGTITS